MVEIEPTAHSTAVRKDWVHCTLRRCRNEIKYNKKEGGKSVVENSVGWLYVAVCWAVHHPPDAKEAALLHLVWLWKMLLVPPFTSLNISWDGVHTLSNNNVMLSSRHFLQTLWFCEPPPLLRALAGPHSCPPCLLYVLFFRPPGQPSPLLALWGREVHQ